MKKSRFTEEQIIKVLKQAESGMPTKEVCRLNGISNGTFFKWKAKFNGMTISDAKKLKSLELENSRLKRMIADMALDIQILKDVNSKKW
jgi:putative transposase